MHSHDRTLLNRLGFSDDDKRNSKHDMACQYLALPENAGRLAKLLFPPESSPVDLGETKETIKEKWVSTVWPGALVRTAFERPLGKGEGKYRTTIGFEDLVLVFSRNERHTERFKRNDCRAEFVPQPDQEWVDREHYCYGRYFVHVEVKASEAKVSDAIRQINLYREYLPESTRLEKSAWVLATCYDVHPDDVAQLKNERIRHVRLGEKFDQFCEERSRQQAGSSPDSEVI